MTLEIELYPRECDCAVCGDPAHPRLGVPMYEGVMVSSEAEDWAGFSACSSCYQVWSELDAAGLLGGEALG